MLDNETVRPLSNGEIFDAAAGVMQQLPHDLDPPSRVRYFLRRWKELGAWLRELYDRPFVGDMVRVDRAQRVVYPEWVAAVLHLEIDTTGATEYTLDSLEQWLHPGQQGEGRIVGNNIYQHLKDKAMLEDCLGLADLLGIQKLGLDAFRRHFAGNIVYGWKSVVRARDGRLIVPCLVEYNGGVNLDWDWLGIGWVSRGPALRFGK